MNNRSTIPEIIESSLHTWKAAYATQTKNTVRFGSLLVTYAEDVTIFGIVHQIQIGSSDTIHMPTPLGKNNHELERDYPTIFPFLQTTIHCLSFGYEENGRIQYRWPPIPPSIHAPVHAAQHEQYARLCADEQYMSMLLSLGAHISYIDELLLAILDDIYQKGLLSPDKIDVFVERFSLSTGNDYRRLKSFLQRAESSFSWHTK